MAGTARQRISRSPGNARVRPEGRALARRILRAGGDYWPTRSWAQSSGGFTIERQANSLEIVCSFSGPAGDKTLEKRFEFEADGAFRVSYRWDESIGLPNDLFAPELSLFAPLDLRPEPDAEIWTFPIETMAKSERGLDRTSQGDSVTFRWPAHLGRASIEVSVVGSRNPDSTAIDRTESHTPSLL